MLDPPDLPVLLLLDPLFRQLYSRFHSVQHMKCTSMILGRLQYEDARAFFLVGVLDRFEDIIQPVSESIW